jgi:hypothetical protein
MNQPCKMRINVCNHYTPRADRAGSPIFGTIFQLFLLRQLNHYFIHAGILVSDPNDNSCPDQQLTGETGRSVPNLHLKPDRIFNSFYCIGSAQSVNLTEKPDDEAYYLKNLNILAYAC